MKKIVCEQWFTEASDIERSILEILRQLCPSYETVDKGVSHTLYRYKIRCRNLVIKFKIFQSYRALSRALESVPLVDVIIEFVGCKSDIENFVLGFKKLYFAKIFRAGG